MDSSGEGDFLVLILDTLAFAHDHDQATSKLLEQVLIFVGAYRLLSESNELVVFALDEGVASCSPIYSSLGENWGERSDWHLEPMRHKSQPWSHQHPYRCIKDGMIELLLRGASKSSSIQSPSSSSIPLSGALSRALCLIHRITSNSSSNVSHLRKEHSSKPRILCITGHLDDPTTYVPMMNAIFSAQRAEVTIDSIVINAADSTFLQQAAHLTRGLYFRFNPQSDKKAHGSLSSGAVLQYLMQSLTADTSTRSILSIHQPQAIDFRASCFCHRVSVETGFVCSVCLAIFCSKSTSCSICGTQFQ